MVFFRLVEQSLGEKLFIQPNAKIKLVNYFFKTVQPTKS